MFRILVQEGADAMTYGTFYKAAVKYDSIIRIRDVVDDLQDGSHPGGFVPNSSKRTIGGATAAQHREEMVLSTVVGGNIDGRSGGGGDICPSQTKKIQIYCD